MTTIPTITPGTYCLTREVKNPQPGRRSSSNWSNSNWTLRAVWPKGMMYFVREETVDMPEGLPDLKRYVLTVEQSSYSLALSDERAQALCGASSLVEETASQLLARAARGANLAPVVLDRLEAMGKFTRADVEAALEHVLDERKGE